ncbi:chromatin associated protein KTI12 [Macrolepiota fuliginosa MF-IS2]|uniref:Chromatin associated protein KTI12 n=1 Tax=Macrolepiota fuliginosa MF-IS2 TaxID=1400762 RepID=A0A9P6C4Y8_9AGAR|nr:chromatin associated protein KTI12 [Macrolepiota fuliginosa MF-IS2]
MAFVAISGYPCSGKSRRATQLYEHLLARLQDPAYEGPFRTVEVISDDSLGLQRSVYDESRAEKPARGALFTAVQRALALDKIVILDSLNYIKGFRYQLYCAAREAKVRVCTVYVVATSDTCRGWNDTRQDGRKYTPETLENLFMRYEEPSSMVRWDSPLFTVLWSDESIPNDSIWEAITKGNIKPPNSGTLNVAKAPADALHTLEQTTTAMVSAIMAERAAGQVLGGPINVTLNGGVKERIVLPERNITLSELQRLKRQFVTIHRKAITLGTTEKGAVVWEESSIAEKFSRYLEENVQQL